MARWIKVLQLPNSALGDINSIYGEHFPIEVRNFLANWIEDKAWGEIDLDNPQHETFAISRVQSLIQELENQINMKVRREDVFLTRPKVLGALRNFKTQDARTLFKTIQTCLASESRIVHEHDPTTMCSAKELSPKNKLIYCDRNILHHLYTNPRLCDIEFIVNDKRFPANRCVMSAASDVFEAMLFGTFQESSRSEIKISDVVHAESFSSLLSYIYGFGIQVDSLSIEVIMEVLKLGHLYGLPKLCGSLQSYVSKLDFKIISEYSFGTNAFMELLNVAFTYTIVDLYDRMKNIIKSSTENVNKFLEHSELVNIKSPILEDIFKDDNVFIEEVKILGAVMKWIDANVDETDCSSVSPMDTKDNDTTSEEHVLRSCDSGSHVSSEIPPKKKRKNDTLVGKSLSNNSGMKLPSHISRCLKNTDHSENIKASGSCAITTDDESSGDFHTNTDKEVNTNEQSDISRLLQTIRSPRLSTCASSKFWEENGSLYKKYKYIAKHIIPYLDNQNPRKPFIQRRILIKCEKNIDKSLYCKISDPVIYDSLNFHLKVSQNPLSSDVSVQLVVKHLNYNCSKEAERFVSLNYSLLLKSFHPFYTGLFVEKNRALCFTVSKKTKPTQTVCTHGYGPQNCHYCLSTFNISHISTYNTNPEFIAITSTLQSTLKNERCQFINNSSFIFEAFIEFNEAPFVLDNP